MFDRKKYKRFAKVQIKGRWTVPVIIVLLTRIVVSIFELPDYLYIYNSGAMDSLWKGNFSEFWAILQSQPSSPTAFPLSMLQIIVAQIFDLAALNVYIKMTRSPEKVSFSSFIEGFNNWGRATLGILWQMLWTFLWMLLFFIPGFIKMISYSQMFYLLAEYDNLSVTKAMRVSMEITRGHKWDLFVMYLSFIGWELLSIITFGISNLFVSPYITLSLLNAYHGMLKEAVESGRITPEDLAE